MNSKLIPLIFISVILIVSAIALPNAFAGIVGFPPFGIPPLKTTFDPSHGSDGGIPIVYYGEPFHVSVDVSGQCIGKVGVVAVTLHLGPFDDGAFGGGEFAAFLLPLAYGDGSAQSFVLNPTSGSVPDSFFDITIPALIPSHGLGSISYTIECGNGEFESLDDGSVFVDPSGQVFNQCTNQPIQGATVTLLRDEGLGFVIPNPAAHIPATNPQSSAANGAYGWMVAPFFDYKVTVSFPGFVPQESGILSIPPEVVGLDFYLVPVNGCPDIIGGEIIPIESTSLILAGFQSSFLWILPLVAVGAGLVIYNFRKN